MWLSDWTTKILASPHIYKSSKIFNLQCLFFVTYSNIWMLDYMFGFFFFSAENPISSFLPYHSGIIPQSHVRGFYKHNFIKNKGYNKVIVPLEKQQDFYEWYNTISIHLPLSHNLYLSFYYYECSIPLLTKFNFCNCAQDSIICLPFNA